MSVKKLILTLASLALWSGTTVAQEVAAAEEPVVQHSAPAYFKTEGRRFTIAGGAGKASSTVAGYDSPTVLSAEFRVNLFDAFAITLGHWQTEQGFRAEGTNAGSISVRAETLGILLSTVLESQPHVRLFARADATRWNAEAKVFDTSGPQWSATDSGTSLAYGVGANVAVHPRTGLEVALSRTPKVSGSDIDQATFRWYFRF